MAFPSFVWHGTDGPDGLIYDDVRVAFQKDNSGVTQRQDIWAEFKSKIGQG